MPKSQKPSPAGTNTQKVKKQNQHAFNAPEGSHGVEFAEETSVQQVRKQNQKAQQNKSKNARP